MEDKINVAELLKDCPKGMEFDCLLCNSPIALECVKDKRYDYPIKAVGKDGFHHVFTKYGTSYNHDDAKCIIYPKGKTTWKGFVPPCKFKDGDIVYIVTDECDYRICIFECIVGNNMHTIASVTSSGHFFCPCKEQFDAENFVTYRLATEEEKEKLFKAIKDNGYKWNAETKTLEKLPKFKVGDRVRHKDDKIIVITITGIKDGYYSMKFYNPRRRDYQKDKVSFKYQDEYEIVPNKFDITTLKPFDKVLVRGDVGQKWIPDFFGFMDKEKGYPFVCVGHYVIQCIPYEGNEHLLGKTDDCDGFYKTWK